MVDNRQAWERLAHSVANHGIVTRRSERRKPTRLHRLRAWC